MSETGEGVRPTRSAEIHPDVSVVQRLKAAENGASRTKFKENLGRKAEDVDSIKYAAERAINEVGKLMDASVRDEMFKVGSTVRFGKFFSVSTGKEDDKKNIDWHKQVNPYRATPPVIIVKVGPEEYLQRGRVEPLVFCTQLEMMLAKPESKKDVWAAVESLSKLSPRDIAKAFRESIEMRQKAIIKQQNLEPKRELRALRRGK